MGLLVKSCRWLRPHDPGLWPHGAGIWMKWSCLALALALQSFCWQIFALQSHLCLRVRDLTWSYHYNRFSTPKWSDLSFIIIITQN